MQDKIQQNSDTLWQNFEKTGSINSYWIYKGVIPENKQTSTTNQQGR